MRNAPKTKIKCPRLKNNPPAIEITMNKIKQILRCNVLSMEIKSISSCLCVSRNTVRRYVRSYQDGGIAMDKPFNLHEEYLRKLFYDYHEHECAPFEHE